MRVIASWVAATLFVMPMALGQTGARTSTESQGQIGAGTTGLTRGELVRSWDLDGDGTISKSEADIARARMRRQRTEMQLDAGIDPVTGLPRRASEARRGPEPEPPYQLPQDLPSEVHDEQPTTRGTDMRPHTRPKPMSELLAPITTTDPVPGLPQLPSITGKPEPSTSAPPIERSGRASWLPPSKTGATGLGGPRAGAPPASSGYGSTAWSDLNAGRFRAAQAGAENPATAPSRKPPTGGGLLPTVRKPGQTGALMLPGQPNPRSTTQVPLAPAPPRPPTFPAPRVTAEDIGGYGP